MALPVSDTIRLFLMLRGHQASNRDKQLAYTSSIILIIATTITIVIKTIIVVICNYTTFRQQCTIKSEYASFQLCEKALFKHGTCISSDYHHHCHHHHHHHQHYHHHHHHHCHDNCPHLQLCNGCVTACNMKPAF